MSENSDLAELAGIPAAAQPLWRKLIAAQLIPVHELFSQVRAYQQEIAQRADWGDSDVDPALARALVESSLKLLGTLGENTPETTRRLIQAAVRYFVLTDDADGDFDSILGLDDDAEVMNAVLTHLGHDRWTVDIP